MSSSWWPSHKVTAIGDLVHTRGQQLMTYTQDDSDWWPTHKVTAVEDVVQTRWQLLQTKSNYDISFKPKNQVTIVAELLYTQGDSWYWPTQYTLGDSWYWPTRKVTAGTDLHTSWQLALTYTQGDSWYWPTHKVTAVATSSLEYCWLVSSTWLSGALPNSITGWKRGGGVIWTILLQP